jgi:hypothetical protein
MRHQKGGKYCTGNVLECSDIDEIVVQTQIAKSIGDDEWPAL